MHANIYKPVLIKVSIDPNSKVTDDRNFKSQRCYEVQDSIVDEQGAEYRDKNETSPLRIGLELDYLGQLDENTANDRRYYNDCERKRVASEPCDA